MEVIIPTGNSVGFMISLAAVSADTSIIAPIKADAIIKNLLSLPNIILQI